VLIFGLLGYLVAKKETKRVIEMLFFPFAIYFVCLSVFASDIEYRYLLHVTPALFMIAAISIDALMQSPLWNAKASLFTFLRSLRRRIPFQKQVSGKGSFVADSSGKWLKWAWLIPLVFLALFFTIGEGILIPSSFYFLESDPYIPGQAYYAYTPQPDFNGAYAEIKKEMKPGDIVISAYPHFTKIFLNQPGYWIAYDYLGRHDPSLIPTGKTEWYVGATTIHTLDELKALMTAHHGFVVFDYMSTDGRISGEMIDLIKKSGTMAYHDQKNVYSEIWVVRF
jgi:hypothetical protein